MNATIHPTSEVSPQSQIGKDTYIWHYVQIRENVIIGDECVIGKNVYIDHDIRIGNRCKIQNNALLYSKAEIEDGVFIGPAVVLTNDQLPRAVKPDFSVRGVDDIVLKTTILKQGCSIGAGAIILPGITIGEYALVGAGSVVTKDVPAFTMVYGNPAKVIAQIDKTGEIINKL